MKWSSIEFDWWWWMYFFFFAFISFPISCFLSNLFFFISLAHFAFSHAELQKKKIKRIVKKNTRRLFNLEIFVQTISKFRKIIYSNPHFLVFCLLSKFFSDNFRCAFAICGWLNSKIKAFYFQLLFHCLWCEQLEMKILQLNFPSLWIQTFLNFW